LSKCSTPSNKFWWTFSCLTTDGKASKMQSKNKTHAQHIRQKHCYACKHMLHLKITSDLLCIRYYTKKCCFVVTFTQTLCRKLLIF
jgi:hypothetical protein